MPQNAIIRADGTGDYTSLTAWEAAEQSVDYGSVTVARLDGFFDLGASQLDINGTWPNGFRIECFDPADKFDGTERSLCGITSTASITFRNRGHNAELSGIEVHNTGTGIAYSNTVVGGNLDHQDCLFKTVSNTAHRANTTAGAGTSGCVMASSTGNPNLGGTYNQCSMFTTLNSAIGSSATTTTDNTVIVNLGTGACYRGTVTQNNNASTDATADTLTNIVIADNFVSATPVASGDYRIKSGSPLDANSIGPFVESAAGNTLTAESGGYLYSGQDVSLLSDRLLQANSGAYNYTGQDAQLLKGSVLASESEGYSYVGQDVNLIYTPAGSFTLIADSGNYTYAGQDINFNRNRVIIATAGSYTYNGSEINIILPGQIWTDKPNVSTNWTDQTKVTTIWTDK